MFDSNNCVNRASTLNACVLATRAKVTSLLSRGSPDSFHRNTTGPGQVLLNSMPQHKLRQGRAQTCQPRAATPDQISACTFRGSELPENNDKQKSCSKQASMPRKDTLKKKSPVQDPSGLPLPIFLPSGPGSWMLSGNQSTSPDSLPRAAPIPARCCWGTWVGWPPREAVV